MLIKYLKTFFEEKQLPEVEWELTANDGTAHFIGSTVVIEHMATASAAEQNKIADVIRRIDFVNGDVNDFLKHLAGALING
jgi:hypothetical protein